MTLNNVYKKYRPIQLRSSQLETVAAEVERLSSENLIKMEQGNLTHEDVRRFHEVVDSLIALTKELSKTSNKKIPWTVPRQVYFNFNGEPFDAFEILGIPDFVPVDLAKAHYDAKYANMPSGERVIYELAIESLLNRAKIASGD